MCSLQKKKWTALLTMILIIILTAGSLGFFLVKADDGTEGIPDFNLLEPDAKGISIAVPDGGAGIFEILELTDLKLALDTKKISMGINCRLSDDIRAGFMETIPGLEDFFTENSSAPDYETLLGDFLTAQGINPLSLNLQISIKGSDPADTKEIWNIIAGATEGMIESKPDSGPGEVIGSYRLEKADTHILSVTAVLDWRAYDFSNYGGLYAGFNFSLDCTDTALSDTSFMEAAWGEHMLDLTVHTDAGSGGGTENPPSYAISKEMTGIQNAGTTEQTSIPFKITAQAGGSGCLNGKTIIDSLDSYLNIRSVKLSADSGPDLDLSPGDYTYENNVFSYTMEPFDGTGPDDSSNVIKDAVITIVTELSDKGTEDLMKDNSLNHTVKNKAQLMEDETVLRESSETNAVIKTQFFNKTGKAYGYTGNQFQWEIKVNSAFSHPVKSYVIDKINLSAHSYAAAEGVTIASGNGTTTSLGITPLTDNTSGNLKAYSELTSSNEESYQYAEAIIDQASGNCAYYRQDEDTGILIIPISGYSKDNITIKYITEAKKSGVSDKVEMHNTAKAVWRWDLGGSGPYPFVPSGDIEVQKDIATDYSLIKKAADNYDSKTQILTWTATVNQYGLEMADGAVITDTIDPSEQIFAGIIGENKPIPVTAYDRITTSGNPSKSFDIPHKDEAGSSVNFYEVVKDSAGMDCLTITIGKKIEAGDYYKLTLQTKVVDSRQLASQHDKNGYTAKNTMKLTVTGSPGISDESTGTTKLSNTLITKEAVNPLYDVNTYESGWNTTVNPNYYPIKDGVVTDTLPQGSTFGRLTCVTMAQKDSAAPAEGVIDASGRSVSFDDGTRIDLEILPDLTADNRQQAAFSFFKGADNIVEASFTFQYTTILSDSSYRQEQLKLNAIALINKVVLDGTINGAPITNAKAEAKKNITSAPAVKKGTWHSEDKVNDLLPYVEWTINVNRNKTDLSGWHITDDIANIFDLDFDSVKFFYGDINSDGSFTAGPEFTDGLTVNKSLNRLDVLISEAMGTTPFIIRFNTWVSGEADTSQMKNSIGLYRNGSNQFSTKEEAAAGAKAFREASYAGWTKSPSLQIIKTSANSIDDNEMLTLADVSFKLSRMEKTGENWICDGWSKNKSTSGSGKASFLALKYDRLYCIEELTSIDGYKGLDEPIYLVFEKEAAPADRSRFPSNTVFYTISASNTVQAIRVENTPGGSLSFYKQNPAGISLPNARFTLTPQGDLAGKTKVRTADSNEMGEVSFENLDPGVYELKETLIPDGYTDGGITYTVTVAADAGKSTCSTELTGSSNITGSGTNESPFIITNGYVGDNKGNITIEKTDITDSSVKLSGAEFALYDGDMLCARAVTGSDGRAYFTLLDLDKTYILKETAAPAGYRLSDEAADITLRDLDGKRDVTLIVTNEKIKEPQPSPQPTVSPAPSPLPSQSPAPSPLPSQGPGPVPQPTWTPRPGQPDNSGEEKTPAPSFEPSPSPEASKEPEASQKPEESPKPEKEPSTASKPKNKPGKGKKITNQDNQPKLSLTDNIAGVEYTLYDKKGNIKYILVTDEKGELDFSEVDEGEYIMLETDIPAGPYEPDDTAYKVTVKKDGEDIDIDAEPTPGAPFEPSQTEAPKQLLPKTGTSPVWMFFLSGMTFIAGGMYLLSIKNRNLK